MDVSLRAPISTMRHSGKMRRASSRRAETLSAALIIVLCVLDTPTLASPVSLLEVLAVGPDNGGHEPMAVDPVIPEDLVVPHLEDLDPEPESSDSGDIQFLGLEIENGRLEAELAGPSRLGRRETTVLSRQDSQYKPHTSSGLVCRPFGECEPCPDDELNQPFCMPFGNRRLLHCLPPEQAHDLDENGEVRLHAGEVPAWEACGKVIEDEKRDYWEFIIANLLFLIVALTILWARTSTLAQAQYRQLAARIGIPGGSWRRQA